MATPSPYPIPKFRFTVDFGGSTFGFQEVSGLDVSNDIIEYREGNSPAYYKSKIRGMSKFSNIIMKHGVIPGNTDFWTWANSGIGSATDRRTLKIMLQNETGDPVLTWKVEGAFVAALKFTDLKSEANEVAVETLEIAHESTTLMV